MDEIQNRFNQIREIICGQRLEGEYVKRNRSKTSKILLILSVINLGIGVSVLLNSINTHTTPIMYNDNVDELVYFKKGAYHIYLDIKGLYQNYQGYTKSISYPQLAGNISKNLKDTSPYDWKNGMPYYPAGAIAYTYFKDIISISNLNISVDDISLGSGRNLIGPNPYSPGSFLVPETWNEYADSNTTSLNDSQYPILNERFVNWINLSFTSNFKKLWGRLNVEEEGVYNLNIESEYKFGNSKAILFVEKSSIGMFSYYCAYCLLFIGGIVSFRIALRKNKRILINIK